ncbi:MAG TPA: hypothetical protein VKC58_12200 [Myxococcales bacterium]|nr:hypothetical protein [Myxococcales bacterium]
MRNAGEGELGGCGVRVVVPRGGGVRRLAWPALAALTAGAAATPLWSSAFLPFQDAPQHLAAIRVLADYASPTFAFQRWFEIDLRNSQYLGFYLPAAALAKFLGPQTACRIVLTLVAFALPAAFWLLLRSFGRDGRLAVFAPAAFHTVPLYLGFFNFVVSVPVAIAGVALFERELGAPSRSRAVLLAATAAALFWLHPSAVAFVLGAAAVLAVTSGRPRPRMARAMAALLPAIALFAGWAALAHPARPDAGGDRPFWQPFREQLLDVGRLGNVLLGHADEVFVLVLAALWFAVATVRGPRVRPERWWRLPALAGVILAAYLATPVGLGYAWYIHIRALPFLALVTLASAVPARRRLTAGLLAAAVALQVGYAAKLVTLYRAFDEEADGVALEQVLRASEPGRSLVSLIFQSRSRWFQFDPFLHFGMYYEVERGGRARYNFAEVPWTPIRFHSGAPPIPEPSDWFVHPERFSSRRHASDTDYVLMRGGSDTPGQAFTLVERAGPWSLYARWRGARSAVIHPPE